MVAVLRRILACPIDHFVDDFTHVEPDFSRGRKRQGPADSDMFIGSSQSALWLLASLRGVCLALLKRQVWNSSFTSCGVVFDLSRSHVDGSVTA